MARTNIRNDIIRLDKYFSNMIGLHCESWRRVRAYIKESRPTVRPKRAVQQRKHAICARGAEYDCAFNGVEGGLAACLNRKKCPHKQHAVA